MPAVVIRRLHPLLRGLPLGDRLVEELFERAERAVRGHVGWNERAVLGELRPELLGPRRRRFLLGAKFVRTDLGRTGFAPPVQSRFVEAAQFVFRGSVEVGSRIELREQPLDRRLVELLLLPGQRLHPRGGRGHGAGADTDQAEQRGGDHVHGKHRSHRWTERSTGPSYRWAKTTIHGS